MSEKTIKSKKWSKKVICEALPEEGKCREKLESFLTLFIEQLADGVDASKVIKSLSHPAYDICLKLQQLSGRNQAWPAIEFIKALCKILEVDPTVADELDSLRKNMLRLVGQAPSDEGRKCGSALNATSTTTPRSDWSMRSTASWCRTRCRTLSAFDAARSSRTRSWSTAPAPEPTKLSSSPRKFKDLSRHSTTRWFCWRNTATRSWKSSDLDLHN